MFLCPYCGEAAPGGRTCNNCVQHKSVLNQHIATCAYQKNPAIALLIESWKYHGVAEAGDIVQSLVQKSIVDYMSLFSAYDVLVPVPLHKKRFAERGFNQAVQLAAYVSGATQLPVVEALQRSRMTEQQARLSKQERLQNVAGAFVLSNKVEITGMRVLLVDDVYTTGATLEACAAVLYAAGAKSVGGYSFARGVLS